MRKFACLLAIAAAPVLTAGAAHAQPAPSQGTGAPRPDVTVRAPERLVCRPVRRTATRMRASRVCRPVSQLTAEGQRSDDEQIADAADTLDVLGADDLSTGCGGKRPQPGARHAAGPALEMRVTMRSFACLLTIAAAPLLAPGAAYAQTGPSPAPGTSPARPDVTVRAPERMVCRNVTRTATRMRASRVCRPVSQMNSADQRSQDEVLADAADTLEVLGEKISTNCVGGMGGSDATGGSGPYRR